MQQWRMIPEHPAYEINEKGRIRKADTHYTITVNGRYAKLSTGGTIVRCLVVDLVAAAFAPKNSRAAIPPRTTKKRAPAKKQTPEKSAGVYKPIGDGWIRHKMSLDYCPWETAKIEGTAMGADPILGF